MPDVLTILDDPEEKFAIVDGKFALAEPLALGTTATALVERDRDGVLKRFNMTVEAIPRIREIKTAIGGRVFPPPQKYFDACTLEANDANYYPGLGSPTHTSVKDGLWSDPTVWSAGTVPGESAVVVINHDVSYNLFSAVKLFSVLVNPAGTLRRSETMATRMVVYSGRSLGRDFIGDHDTHEILYWFPESPGTTTKGGWVYAGITRHKGKIKRARSWCADLAAGATTIVLDSEPTNWQVGDEILIGATDHSGVTSTDPTYTGPTSGYLPTQNSYAQRTNNAGYATSQDETRTITAISGNTITINAPLIYAHAGATGTLPIMPFKGPATSPTVQTIVLKPFVCIKTQSILHRTLGAADSAIWTGDLTNVLKRAHVTFLHSDNQDVRGVQFRDMGRSKTDITMVDDHGVIIRATNGGTVLTAATNVNNRHAVNILNTGPYLSRKAVTVAWFTADASSGAPPMPGHGVMQNNSRAHVEHGLVHYVRGSCVMTMKGNEIGHQLSLSACHALGDGFGAEWGDRAEALTGHQGHYGTGFHNQARQIQIHGCIVTSCKRPYDWMPNNPEFTTNTEYFLRSSVRDVDLRLYDPLTQGGEQNGNGVAGQDAYGPRQPQIADFVGNKSYGCMGPAYVAHRKPERQDRTPMIVRQYHCLNAGGAFRVQNYSNTYYFYDCLWVGKGTGSALSFGNVTWRNSAVNCLARNWSLFAADDGAGLNYEGVFNNIALENVGAFSNNPYVTLGQAAATHPARNVMGDWVDHPTNANQAIVRQWRNMTDEEFPMPYPLAPYGLKMPDGMPVVAYGESPYFWLDAAASDVTMVMGNVRNQLSIKGVIRDSAGDQRFGDFMSSESGLASAGIKSTRTAAQMTAEQCIIRNGCWLDGAQWKSRAKFTDADRRTGAYFNFFVDVSIGNVNGANEGLLLANVIDPDASPHRPDIPEVVDSLPLNVSVTPQITSQTTFTIPENTTILADLRANVINPTFIVSGGEDAALLEIVKSSAGTSTIRLIGGKKTEFETVIDGDHVKDANGDNAFKVNVVVLDVYGNASDPVPYQWTVTNLNENYPNNYSTSFTDVNGTDLAASGDWEQIGGVTGAGYIAYGGVGIKEATGTSPAATYVAPSRISDNYVLRTQFENGAGETMSLLCMTDVNTWIGLRELGGRIVAYKCVGGVRTAVYTASNSRSQSGARVVAVEKAGDTFTHKEDGVTIGTFTRPTDVPVGDKQGLFLNGTRFDQLYIGFFAVAPL